MLIDIQNPRRFYRRINGDGTVDSICSKCFLTVHGHSTEEALCEAELDHVCDVGELAAFEAIRTMREGHSKR